MIGFERSDDYQPLFWVGGRPVHVTTLLVGLHIGALLICSVLQGAPTRAMALSSDAVLHHWALWQPLTYAFDHLLGDFGDTITFIVEMFMLYRWGQEVTLYPSVQFFWGIASKWVAVAFAALLSAAFFSQADYPQLMVLWSTIAMAYYGVRYASVGGEAFAFLGNLRERFPRKTAPRGVRPRLKPRRAIDSSEPPEPVGAVSSYRAGGDVHESIDPLLDKISKHGLASLTHSERATLERARVSLLRKERGG